VDYATVASSLDKSWRKKGIQLFGQLVKAGEVERALDVARCFLAHGDSGKMLEGVQKFAEKAGHHKLADKIAELPRLHVPDVAGGATSSSSAGKASQLNTTAAVSRAPRELPRLFAEGEFEEKKTSTDQTFATPEKERPASCVPVPADAHSSDGSKISSLEDPTAVPDADKLEQARQILAAPPLTTTTTTTPVNPFARKRQAGNLSGGTPHLLRDTLGGSSRRVLGEPASKVAKVNVASSA